MCDRLVGYLTERHCAKMWRDVSVAHERMDLTGTLGEPVAWLGIHVNESWIAASAK